MSSPMAMVSRFVAATKDLFLGTNLAALKLITRPRSLRRCALETLFLQRSVAPTRLQSRMVSQVLPASGDVRLQLLPDGENWFAYGASFALDILNLCILCRALHARNIFEIGTFHGYTTLHLAINSADDATINTLDLGPDAAASLDLTEIDRQVIRERDDYCCFRDHPAGAKIRRFYGDSAKFDFSSFRGNIDLFFIDGAHSYEYVKADTQNALKCCHSGSAIAWHDYGRPQFGVTRYLDELATKMEVYVVPCGSLAFTILK